MLTVAPKFQYHLEPLSIIESFKKTSRGRLNKVKSPLNNIVSYLAPSGKAFSLRFEYDRFTASRKKLDVGQIHKNLAFSNRKTTLILQDVFLGLHTPPQFTGSVSFFYTKGFSKTKEYYYRLIIPLKKQLRLDYTIDGCIFETDIGYRSRTGTMATINNDDLYVSIIDNKKNKSNRYYLAIESRKCQTYESFSEKAFAVKNAIGYLTGYLAGDNGWFFAYTRKEMKSVSHYYFCEMRDTIKSMYVPIYSNPFGYLRDKNRVAEKLYKDKVLKGFTIPQFSSLCQKLHDSIEFSSTVMLILESSVASLLFMPGGYAIALESMSDIIVGDTKLKLAPIKSPSISRLVRKECLMIIDKYCKGLSTDDYKALEKKINQLNQTTNKARLKAPFNLLGINLTQEDTDILETRNDFLHGRIPDITKIGANRTTERKNKDLYYSAVRFYTLLNRLILKWVGYDNFVLNHPKLQEQFTKIKLKEPYYISLS